MFKSRSGSQGNPSTPPPQSIEAVRRRARHRLIGASVLVLLGVVGFPLLFDTQPRPIPVDIPIEIPAKNLPPAPTKTPAPRPPAESVNAREALGAKEEVVESRPATATAPAPASAPAHTPAPSPAKTPADADRARALLEGKPAAPAPAPAPAAAASERLVVQVGAFSEEAGARAVRQKLEAAGLKTYTQVTQTADGRRIRVRLGPYESRAEAEKVAARVKALGVSASVLTL
jgi:DedD protein